MFRRAWRHGFSAVRRNEAYEVWHRGLKGIEYSKGDLVLRIGIELAAADVN